MALFAILPSCPSLVELLVGPDQRFCHGRNFILGHVIYSVSNQDCVHLDWNNPPLVPGSPLILSNPSQDLEQIRITKWWK